MLTLPELEAEVYIVKVCIQAYNFVQIRTDLGPGSVISQWIGLDWIGFMNWFVGYCNLMHLAQTNKLIVCK